VSQHRPMQFFGASLTGRSLVWPSTTAPVVARRGGRSQTEFRSLRDLVMFASPVPIFSFGDGARRGVRLAHAKFTAPETAVV